MCTAFRFKIGGSFPFYSSQQVQQIAVHLHGLHRQTMHRPRNPPSHDRTSCPVSMNSSRVGILLMTPTTVCTRTSARAVRPMSIDERFAALLYSPFRRTECAPPATSSIQRFGKRSYLHHQPGRSGPLIQHPSHLRPRNRAGRALCSAVPAPRAPTASKFYFEQMVMTARSGCSSTLTLPTLTSVRSFPRSYGTVYPKSSRTRFKVFRDASHI